MHISEIVQRVGMSNNPGFYSGRGARLGDLDYKILTKISELIEFHYGKDAQKNFVKMIAAMKKMSATDFLNELYALSSSDWIFKECQRSDNGISPTSIGSAQATVFSVLSGMNNEDDTSSIRNRFLRENGVEFKKEIDFETLSKYGDVIYRERPDIVSDDAPERLKKLYEDDDE